MLLSAANTIILQTRHGHEAGHHVSYAGWLVGTVVPMWLGSRVAARTWSAAWQWGRRHVR